VGVDAVPGKNFLTDFLGGCQRGRVVVLPAFGYGVCRYDVVRLGLIPPLLLLHRCQRCVGGAPFSGEAYLGVVCCLGVLVFLLPVGFLAPSGQCLGNAGGDHKRLPHAAVHDIIHSI
jgi:hypothetical protein